MNICEAIVNNLESIGVDTIFGGSGQSIADLLMAVKRSEKTRCIIPKHEQAAAFMACGYSMFTDKLGVCACVSGPGAFNLFSGLGVALSDSLPVLAITSFAAKKFRGRGDLGETSGLHRTPNSREMFAAITKRSFFIDHPDKTCDIVEMAVNLAFEGRPGPVHIDVPYFDFPAPPKESTVTNYRDIALEIAPVDPDPKTISAFAHVLASALTEKKKVLALLGYGCVRSHAEKEIRAFLERYQIPFISTMDAKGFQPEDHPLCHGVTGVSGDPSAKKALHEADVVLALGNSFGKWSTWRWEPTIFDEKQLLYINIDSDQLNRVYAPDVGMVSDIRPAIAALDECLRGESLEIVSPKKAEDRFYQEDLAYDGDKVHPGQLARAIGRLAPANSIILGDAGAHMLWMHAYMQLNDRQIFQNPGIFGPMASNVNAAVGVQCADPERRVIVGCGDGDYLMSGYELMTAIQHNVPVVWIIFNNSEFGIIKMMHRLTHEGEDVFNQFDNMDFTAYAAACGAPGFKVERIEDFEGAFQEALDCGGPALIEVMIDAELDPPINILYHE
jgi:acetolactate synthase I/II/III large subunit